MAAKILQQSFGGGEVSPDFWGRVTDSKYQAGLAACRNFVVLPHGPVVNRPGFKFVRAVGEPTVPVKLIPFTYNVDQTMVLEFGQQYVRFHTQGASLLVGTPAAWSSGANYAVGDLVTSGGTVYYCILAHTNQAPPNATYWFAQPASGVLTVPSPYAGADVMDLHYVQSGDVLTVVHPGYAPRELRRLGATNWTLTTIAFTPSVAAPAAPSVGGIGPTPSTLRDISYVMTRTNGADESLPTAPITINWNFTAAGAKATISYTLGPAGERYNFFKRLETSGEFGFIGSVPADRSPAIFVDDNITPDFSYSPPEVIEPFSGTGNYPGAVTYHEQRRWFGGTVNSPLGLWATKSGTESSMTRTPIPRDDDALSFRVASREANRIRHLVPLGDLLPFTAGSEMRVTSVNTDAITPTSVNVKTESYVGANNVQPVIANTNIVYAAARGGHVRELGYSEKAGGQATGDLSLRAVHLFDTLQIVDLAYSKAPYPIVWAVSNNGYLLGLTYVPEQDVGAWHRHDTDGNFKSICCVAEGNEDVLYAVVQRTVGGVSAVYIERMSTRLVPSLEQAFFVDSGLTYSGSPATVISGLGHLEGKTVAILADGAVHPERVVTSGSITLEAPASLVHVGLPYVSEIRTLPLAMQVDAALGQGRMKNVNAVYVRVHESAAFEAGPDDAGLREAKWRTVEPYGSPPMLRSEEIEVVIPGDWNPQAQVTVQQRNPLPLSVVSMTLEVVLGG